MEGSEIFNHLRFFNVPWHCTVHGPQPNGFRFIHTASRKIPHVDLKKRYSQNFCTGCLCDKGHWSAIKGWLWHTAFLTEQTFNPSNDIHVHCYKQVPNGQWHAHMLLFMFSERGMNQGLMFLFRMRPSLASLSVRFIGCCLCLKNMPLVQLFFIFFICKASAVSLKGSWDSFLVQFTFSFNSEVCLNHASIITPTFMRTWVHSSNFGFVSEALSRFSFAELAKTAI